MFGTIPQDSNDPNAAKDGNVKTMIIKDDLTYFQYIDQN